MAVPTVMSELSTTAASNSPAGSESPTSGDDFLRAIGAILRTTNAKGSDIASATTTDIGAATAEFVDVTGTTTITGLGTIAAGIRRAVRFTGALTLTHNSTSLILPGSANITTVSGDVAEFRSLGSGNWICTGYLPKAALAVLSTQLQAQTFTTFTTGGTSTAYTLTPTPALTSLATGQRFNVTFNATAGATPTLAISGLTAKSLKYYDSTGTKQAVTSTNVVANLNSDVIYDGTDYVVVSPAGVVSFATNATYVTGTATTEVLSPSVARARNLVAGTTIATTSGTSHDFTGLPSWVKQIRVVGSGNSSNGVSPFMVQIGDAGGVETSGYSGGGTQSGIGSVTNSTGFQLFTNVVAANSYYFELNLTLLDAATNLWQASAIFGTSNVSFATVGSKTLSGVLDRLRLTTVGGADTFDAGSLNIIYE